MNETKNEIKNGELKKNIQEQFKSTKKWNDLVDVFCGNMPLKRHWRNFRTYTDCFSASEAIEWLYRHLKTNQAFSHLSISRQNAVKVLQIFLKEKVIEDVRSNENFTHKEFQDDDRIYRFSNSNPHYLNRTTSSSLTTSSSITNSTTLIDFSSTNEIKSTSISDIEIKNQSNFDDKFCSKIKPTLENNNVLNEITSSSLNTQSLKQKENMNINGFKSIDENEAKTQHHAKMEKVQKISKYATIPNIKQIDIWSRTTRKLLESTLKKAILNKHLIKQNKFDDKISNKEMYCPTTLISLSANNNNHIIQPPCNSTLKRHTDIKINLSKLLDKKAYEFLMNLNGANIKHNCTNVNKHGVVINTEEDFPPWLVKAMSTLILWENENEKISIDEQFPKFEDVFNEILSYFGSLNESLISKEMTHLFIEILKLLVVTPKSVNTSKFANHENHYTRENFKSSRKRSNDFKKSSSFEFSTLEKCLPNSNKNEQYSENFFVQSATTLSTNIRNLVILLKEQLSDFESLKNNCMSYQLKELISNISTGVQKIEEYQLDENLDEQNEISFEAIEAKLILKAKLEFEKSKMIHEEDNTLNITELTVEQKEILQNLLLASIADLENCCEDCLSTYKEISEYINANALEFNQLNEYLERLNNYEHMINRNEENFEQLSEYTEPFLDEHFNENYTDDIFDENCLTNLTNVSAKQYLKHKLNAGGSKCTINLSKSLKENFSQQKLNGIPNKNESEVYENKIEFFEKDRDKYNNMGLITADDFFCEANENKDSRKLLRNNSFRAAIGDIKLFKSDENDDSVPQKKIEILPKKRCSLARSATNDFTLNYKNINDFDFKKPNSLFPNFLPKSVSMNFSSLEPSQNDSKKRKISTSSNSSNSSVYSISEYKAIRESESRKINDSMILPLNLIEPNSNGSWLNGNIDMSQEFSNNLSHKNLNNYSSLRNLNSFNTNNITRSNLSLNELSSFIKFNLPKNFQIQKEFLSSVKSKHDQENDMDQDQIFLNALSVEIDSEVFHFILNAFRLCSLMLPPNEKRKLHLLLRFLNKLKYNKYTAKYLLPSTKFINNYEDLHFIDSSINEPMRRSQLNSDLEFKSAAIELIIIKSFLKTIVSIGYKEQQTKDILIDKLAIKLVQILIDNYTEIMRIPEDLKSSVFQKLNVERKNFENQPKSLHESEKEFHQKPKISLHQYDQLTKQELTNLLNKILTDITMCEKERLSSIKKFKEAYPLIYEEKYSTIKKALNILGISESGSKKLNEADADIYRKRRDFSSESEFRKTSLFLVNSNSKRIVGPISSSNSKTNVFSNAKNLTLNFNRTNDIPASSKISMNSMIQSTSSSINFSKLFMNKKKKQN